MSAVTRKHPVDCNHCASIRGDRNPAKRPEVRKAISEAARQPDESFRRSQAISGNRNPKYNPSGSYKAAHVRVVNARGLASQYLCRSCSNPAEEWALNKDAPGILLGPGPREMIMPYSLNPEEYDPLCKSCHRKRDGQKGYR